MTRDRVLQIRLTEYEFASLEQQAEEQMIPISTLARRIIIQGAHEKDGQTP